MTRVDPSPAADTPAAGALVVARAAGVAAATTAGAPSEPLPGPGGLLPAAASTQPRRPLFTAKKNGVP